MAQICKNQYSSSNFKDETGKKFVMCQITKTPCTSQRFCSEVNKYIVSEKAEKYCKNYK